MELIQQIIRAGNWEERYRMLIRAGKNLPRPSEAELAAMRPIAGCEAKVWFNVLKNDEKNDRTFHFQAYSEARIVNGLLWLLLLELNGKTAVELQQFDLTDYFTTLGIAQRLSATRLNGLRQIENLVRALGEQP